MVDTNAATVVYRAVGRPTVVVDTNGSRLVIHQLNTPEDAVRWGHTVDDSGRIRGIVIGTMALRNAFVVQEIRECKDVIVWRGSISGLTQEYGAAISSLVDSEIISAGLNTGNCTTGEIRFVRRRPSRLDRNDYDVGNHIYVRNVVIRNAVYIKQDDIVAEHMPCLQDIEFKFDLEICAVGRSAFVLAANASYDPPHPHLDSGRRFCVDHHVLRIVRDLYYDPEMRLSAILILLESLRNINLSDCYGHFREHYHIKNCEQCHRWTTATMVCHLCGSTLCPECHGNANTTYCRRCFVTGAERELLGDVDIASRGIIQFNLMSGQTETASPPELLPVISRECGFLERVHMPYEYNHAPESLRHSHRYINWRRVVVGLSLLMGMEEARRRRELSESLLNYISGNISTMIEDFDVSIPEITWDS